MLNLRSRTRKALFAYFFTNPHASHHLRELSRLLELDAGNLSRELSGLVSAGVMLVEEHGNQRWFRVNTHHPLYPELKKIVFKTIGIAGELRERLKPIAGIEGAFLYGSFARGNYDEASDVDVMIIGEPRMEDVENAMLAAQSRLQREVNYSVMSPREFRKRIRSKDAFLTDIMENKRVELISAS